MPCKLQNIKDPVLVRMISEYGAEEGATMYLEQYGEKPSIGQQEFTQFTPPPDSLFDDLGINMDEPGPDIDYREPEPTGSIDIEGIGETFIFNEKDFEDDPLGYISEFTGASSGIGSGVSQIMSKVTEKILDAKRAKDKLNDIAAKINSEIATMKKSGVDESSFDIKDLRKRLSAVTAKIDTYRNAISKLFAHSSEVRRVLSAPSLRSLFDVHRAFALEVANSENADEGDFIIAENAMSMWSGLRSLIFDIGDKISDVVDTSLQEIETLSSNVDVNVIRSRMQEKFIKTTGEYTGINLSRPDVTVGVDVDYGTLKTMSLGATKNKTLSAIHGFLQRAVQKINVEYRAVREEISNMFRELKKAGLNMDMFIDKDFNLIDRIHGDFYKNRQAVNDEFDTDVENAYNVVTGKYDNDKLKLALRKRNSWIKDRILVINPEDMSTPDGRQALKDRIIKITGDESYAEDRLIDAQMKYEQFQHELAYRTEELKNQFVNGTTRNGVKLIETAEELAIKIDNISKYNSPVQYAKDILGSADYSELRLSDRLGQYSTEIPLREYAVGTPTGFYNDAFTSIQNNPNAYKFYTEYSNMISRMLKYLPVDVTKGLSKSFLPQVREELWGRVSRRGFSGFFSGMKAYMIDAITVEPGVNGNYGTIDTEGKQVRSIPIRYINKIDAADRSKDLEKILHKFSEMAISYKHLSQVEDKVMLANSILNSMKSSIVGPDGKPIKRRGVAVKSSDKLIKAIAMAQHSIDVNLYGIKTNVEGILGSKLFDPNKSSIKIIGSVNPVPILNYYNMMVASKGKEVAMSETKNKFSNNVIFITEKQAFEDIEQKKMEISDQLDAGTITEKDALTKIEAYELAQSSMGRNISISKIADNVVGFSYLKSFAYNVFPAFANDVFGDIAIMNHAVGRQDYNPTQARWALIAARLAVAKAIRGDVSNKIMKLGQLYNIFTDQSEGLNSSKSYNFSIAKPFGALSAGDAKNRLAVMAAMMRNKKIKDLAGNDRELYEAYNEDAVWNTKEFGENKDWNGNIDSMEENKEFLKFGLKSKRVSTIIHGNMDPETAPEVKRYVIGRLLAQYRLSWMAEGVAARFQPKIFDEILERNQEGRYITTFKYMKKNGLAGGLSTILKLMAFQGEAAFNGKKMTDKDKAMVMANVRKTLNEMYYYMALWGVYLTLKATLDDDDDETKGLKYVALNTVYRIMGDISFYSSPGTFNQIINNPIPILGIYTDFSRFTRTVSKHMAGEEYYDENIVFRDFVRQIPILNMYPKWEYRSKKLLMNQSGF